jgi:hypothetical protein
MAAPTELKVRHALAAQPGAHEALLGYRRSAWLKEVWLSRRVWAGKWVEYVLERKRCSHRTPAGVAVRAAGR